MDTGPRTLLLGVGSTAVLPGRVLEILRLEISAESMVLYYQVTPGITESELRLRGVRLIWGAFLEDDVGTGYWDGLQSGGFSTDEAITVGDRTTTYLPPPEARFLTISIYSPPSHGDSYGSEVLACHVPLNPSATGADLAVYLERRRRGRYELLRRIARAPGMPIDDLPLVSNVLTHPWARSLAAARLIEQHGLGWRTTPKGEVFLGPDSDDT